MRVKKKGLPEDGDIVLATVERLTPHAAFVKLDEYEGVEGIIHISEVSKSWVKNIKSHLRLGQKVVCKVIEIKPKERFAYLSIRRVSDYDRKAKWDQIKRQRRVENIVELIAKELGTTFEEVYEKLAKLEKKYGEIYFGLEEIKVKGKKELAKYLPKSWVDKAWEIIDKSISLPKVTISGIITLKSYASDGIDRIKKILTSIDGKVHYLGVPRYKVEIEDTDYKKAEKKLEKMLKNIEKMLTKDEEFSFEREKK